MVNNLERLNMLKYYLSNISAIYLVNSKEENENDLVIVIAIN